MTFFLHVDSLKRGLDAAEPILSSTPDPNSKLTYQQVKLIQILNDMKTFAETNLQEMLSIMGFDNIEALNAALQNYNDMNLSLQQIFPAFAAPQMSEVFQRTGISKIGGTDEADYGLVLSAFEDAIQRRFPQFMEEEFYSGEIQSKIQQALKNEEVSDTIANDVMAQLFGGITLETAGFIDLDSGNIKTNIGIDKLINAINKAASARGATKTNIRTLMPFYREFLKPFIENTLNRNFENLINRDEYYQILEEALKEAGRSGNFNREILRERIKRGGITISSKLKSGASTSNNGLTVTSYIDSLQINLDPKIFNLEDRKGQTVEEYVNNICEKDNNIRIQIINNIKNFYWNLIVEYMPAVARDALINTGSFTKDNFDIIINNMVREKDGSIGWFFSQGVTKELGAGMFGEIAGMVYMSLLCPNLVKNGLNWAGGVVQDGAKPPADIFITNGTKSYGIQVKNYSSSSTLEHEYNLAFKNILNMIDEEQKIANIEDSGFMSSQIFQEFGKLGITQNEIEQVQNIIIANTFNVPYKKENGKFVGAELEEVPQFSSVKSRLTNLFNKATHYMALVSLIMHRLQYADVINRKISATSKLIVNDQLQNTLWLINGKLFVSSVQILDQLIAVVKNELQNFFNISTRVRYFEKKMVDGKEKTVSHNLTIVEFFNLNMSSLTRTSLNTISATIGTQYRMGNI